MTEELALEISDVSINFGGIQALDSVELAVAKGARIGLIGPNGAGKSTLINCVAGDLRPDTGSVRLFGESISGASAPSRARLGISRTFQNLELFNAMPVIDNVTAALDVRIRGRARVSGARSRAREALASFGIEKYADLPAGSLPYGIRKLVELSRAFVREPEFLLLDEPVAGLSQPEKFLITLVEGLDRLGCAVLLVEHDMPTVKSLCEYVYVLDTGALIAQGTFAEVASDERVVAAYLGAEA
ncbi:ABC transporter ATP-binding protein [Nocardioides jensenii]|uniref:ABC transporter ATP-binding protein n=1 Tax=Nocardioides jensenii TaxID=1843 RepID=UPI00082C6AD7|nr:ABC transporter ATP-binding protein [Nocardioides jensenii]